MSNKEQEFLSYVKEMKLLEEAIYLLEWDSQTGMPEKAAEHRSEVSSYLSGKLFEMETGETIAEYIRYFEQYPSELSDSGGQVLDKIKEYYDLNHSIPTDRMQAFSKEESAAHSQWIKAREAKDFQLFFPSLVKLIDFTKEFIPLWQKDEKTPYDVLLNQYEPNMTVETLDKVFAQVRKGIMEIRQTVAEKGTVPETDFLFRHVSKQQQEKFVKHVITEIGYDFSRGRLDDTVHPFMIGINRNDARITNRWSETDFAMATFGCIHEAGHGIYEQNIDKKYDYTPLTTGASMGIHESQSLFNEIIIGSSRAFWKKQYPVLQQITNGTFDDVDFESFYKGLKKSQASLIRIESDPLTYPLHIIIRYEIEKMIFNDGVAVADLPKIWNDKYEEYLGIRPENDLEGILQDVHWANASFGYFPSYALGYMYACQLHHSMSKEVETEEVLASEDYSPIRKWLTHHIHQYGASRKPNQLIFEATGESLNPQYLLDFMKNLYFDIYNIK